MRVTFDPGVISLLAGTCFLYASAVRRLAARRVRVPGWQQSAWYGGIALMAVALLGPFDSLGEELLSFHMAEHLLIADLAAPLLLVGLRWPGARAATAPDARRAVEDRHVVGARLPGMFLGMAFIVIRVPVYTGAYGGEQRAHGFTAIADQQLGRRDDARA